MSAPNKLRGGSESELTRFKKLWRDSLAESARDFWRALFISEAKQADIRAQLATKLKIKLSYDKQLNAFRKWLDEQDARDDEARRMQDDERRLTESFGDTLSKDQIREKVLSASYARTLATGDFKLGLQTVDRDLKAQQVSLDREKFEELKRKAAQADEAKTVTSSQLSPEQKQAEYRRIFGMA